MEQNWNLRIVGHNTVLNQLVAMAVQDELHLECGIYPELEPRIMEADPAGKSSLLLVDDSDPKARFALCQLLNDRRIAGEPHIVAALFNIDSEKSETSQAVRCGVTGLFFHTDSLDELLEGITTLLRGEVWIPRDVLVSAATDPRRHARMAVEQSGLTLRETEILTLVSTGATNDQIAQQLCISPHTVKTHLYNIFRKIRVDNRFRAALWVTQNLGLRPPLLGPRSSIPMAAGQ